MAVNIGPKIGIDGEAEYRRQLNNIIQQTRTLKSEYDKVSSSMEKGKTTLKGNAEQHRILTEQIKKQEKVVEQNSKMLDEARKKYDLLDDELKIANAYYGENSEEVKRLAAEQDKAQAACERWEQNTNKANTALNVMRQELKDLPSAIQIVGDRMQETGDKIASIGNGIKNIGSALTPISMAASGAIAGSVKVFSDFESQMSRVKAISGATGDEFESLSQKAREMGASTKYTATESGEAFEYMAMAGWKSEQMLEGIAPVMNLAAASGEELGTVSDIVTDALTAFGLQAQDAARFTDVLAATATNANTNVGMMGESFKYAAPVAGSLGYSIEDVSLALGLMANNGIKADMAGTALRNMLQRMAKPTKESAAAMDRLGVYLTDDEEQMLSLRQILDQLRESFGQINLPIDSFNNILDAMNNQLEDGTMTEKEYEKELDELIKQAYGAEAAEKARAAAMLAGARAMPALLAIVNTSEKDYRKLASAIDNSTGAAEKMADTMIDNTAGAVTIMKSALEGAGIELGEVFAPYVTKAANYVQDLAVKFSKLSDDEQETIAKQIAFAAASAPALKAIGGMTQGIGNLVSTGGKFANWLGGLGPAAGPMAIFVAGTAAAVGGIIALQKSIDDFEAESINKALSKALMNEGGMPIEEVFGNITDKITELSGTFEVVEEKSAALEGAGKNVDNLVAEIDKIKISMDAGVTSTEEGAAQIEEKIGGLADAISAKMSAASDVLLAALGDGGALAQSLDRTGIGVDEMRKKVVESSDDIQKEIGELQETLNNSQWGSDAWFEAYNRLMELGGGVDSVKESVEGFEDSIKNNPIDWSAYFGDDGTFDFEAFKTDLQTTTDAAVQFSEGMKTSMDATVEAAEQLGNAELTDALKNAIPGAMAEGNAQIAEKALESVNLIQNDMIGGIDEVITQAEADWAEMSPWKKLFVYNNDQQGYVLGQVRQYKADTVDPASAEIEAMMNELGVEGAGWAGEAMDEIIAGLFTVPSMEEQSQGAKITLKSNWETILKDMQTAILPQCDQFGKDVVDGMNSGIESNSDSTKTTAETWMQKLKDAIHNSAMKFGSPSQTAKDFGKDTIDGFNQGITENQGTSESTVSSWMGLIESTISEKVPTITGLFADIKEGVSTNMKAASDAVSSAMETIKGIFNTKLEFPHFDLPHFKVKGEFNLKSIPPKVPSLDVDWYSKAMNGGMLLDGATIFGAAGNTLLGGGEAGKEWIVGEASLMDMIQQAVNASAKASSSSVTIGDTTINVYAPDGADAEEIAEMVEDRINSRYQRLSEVWA